MCRSISATCRCRGSSSTSVQRLNIAREWELVMLRSLRSIWPATADGLDASEYLSMTIGRPPMGHNASRVYHMRAHDGGFARRVLKHTLQLCSRPPDAGAAREVMRLDMQMLQRIK